MAQVKVKQPACDRCGSTKKVERRTLLLGESKHQARFDACLECRKTVALIEWERLVEASPRKHALRPRQILSEAEAQRVATPRRGRKVMR